MKGGNCGLLHEGGRRRKRTMRGGGYSFSPDQAGSELGAGNALRGADGATAPAPGGPHGVGEFADGSRGGNASGGGRRRRGSRKTRRVVKKKSVATIKRLLKAKGLKVSGSRRALTARARKARISMKGGGMVTGTPYGGYVGTGSAGMASQFVGAHPVANNVITTGGYGLNTAESGGGVEA
uniref:SAP domain-containing protein n=1 Tax=viral metagenome TaxID=1070528 RepID=A0A6C0JGH9_9ZZZZ